MDMDLVTAIGLGLLPLSVRRDALERWRRQPSRGVSLGAMLDGLVGTDRLDLAALRTRAEVHALATSRASLPVVWIGQPAYPPLLEAIADAPPACWVLGDAGILSAPSVAIVGSRAVAADTAEAVTAMASALAAAGLAVVSGLARGVDAAAHEGAVEGGRTIAVLGSSHDRLYPAEHDALAARILQAGGALLTEWPPGTPARPGHFPARNRIVSGLSRGVVVAEASERSGALITAGHALDQGREVMAMPGTPWGGRNRGAHGLLKDGAALVEDASDVVAVLLAARALDDWSPAAGAAGALPGLGLEAPARTGAFRAASPDERAVAALSRRGRATPDELRLDLGWSTTRILAVFSGLELDGRAVRVPGGWILGRGR